MSIARVISRSISIVALAAFAASALGAQGATVKCADGKMHLNSAHDPCAKFGGVWKAPAPPPPPVPAPAPPSASTTNKRHTTGAQAAAPAVQPVPPMTVKQPVNEHPTGSPRDPGVASAPATPSGHPVSSVMPNTAGTGKNPSSSSASTPGGKKGSSAGNEGNDMGQAQAGANGGGQQMAPAGVGDGQAKAGPNGVGNGPAKAGANGVGEGPAKAGPNSVGNGPAKMGSPLSSHPPGTTAKCKDGTYSTERTKLTACMYHGGIDTWY